MDHVGMIIFFCGVGAFICAKARVAGGAVVFALLGLVFFVGTPLGSALPSAVSGFLNAVNSASTPVLNKTVADDAEQPNTDDVPPPRHHRHVVDR